MDKYLEEILEDKSNIKGEIYKITNQINNKCYVGQTTTHRKNKKKYRPFGFRGRFKDHIHSSLLDYKYSYLYCAIRKYGSENFKVELLTRCELYELDEKEREWIQKLNSMFPNGYNLTIGGKTFAQKYDETKWNISDIRLLFVDTSKKSNWRNLSKSNETKEKIKTKVNEWRQKNKQYTRESSFILMEKNFYKKIQTIKELKIDINEISLKKRYFQNGNFKRCDVNIGSLLFRFCCKYYTEEENYNYAVRFINEVKHICNTIKLTGTS